MQPLRRKTKHKTGSSTAGKCKPLRRKKLNTNRRTAPQVEDSTAGSEPSPGRREKAPQVVIKFLHSYIKKRVEVTPFPARVNI